MFCQYIRIALSAHTFRFADLFAGLGGFHLALARLGGECVFASEWKPGLQQLYKRNHGILPHGDITTVNPDEIEDHDVLTAGFPCQPFSKAGDQLGFECTEQGKLFFNVEAILRAKRPSFFILENVPNLLKHDEGRTWATIQETLGGDLGYHIQAERLSPHHFGIPQIRERVYIVGSRAPLTRFRWPDVSDQPTSIEDVLQHKPADAKPLSAQVERCLEVWDDFLRRAPANLQLPSFPLWSMEWGATYPFENETPHARLARYGIEGLNTFKGSHGKVLGRLKSIEARLAALPSHARKPVLTFPTWKKTFIRQNRQFFEDNKSWIEPWLPQVLEFPSSLQKFEWNLQGEERSVWKHVVQFRASGVRVKRRTTAPSLIAMTDTQVPIIAWERRYMTPRECAALQSMEDLKFLPESRVQAFSALGNAVNSKVVEQVASALLSGVGKPNLLMRREATDRLRVKEAEAC